MTPLELKQCYENGENITKLLREANNTEFNTDEIIELAYDLQSGNYIKGMKEDEEVFTLRDKYISEVVEVIEEYHPNPQSFFKGGVGEAVTLALMLEKIDSHIDHVRGIDMCWSRLAYGKNWLTQQGFSHVQLAMATLSEIPFEDNTFDIVVTSHSMEPNGGREKEILTELYRISAGHLFICEPCFEIADEKGKERMIKLGYVKGLEQAAKELGYNILENRIVRNSMNSLNPTSILIIEKKPSKSETPNYACPVSKKRLKMFDSCYYSEELLSAYPIIAGIPCLRKTASVICSKLPEVTN